MYSNLSICRTTFVLCFTKNFSSHKIVTDYVSTLRTQLGRHDVLLLDVTFVAPSGVTVTPPLCSPKKVF